MTDHSGAIVNYVAVRRPDLVVSALHSLTTYLAEVIAQPQFPSGPAVTCSHIQHGYKPEWTHMNAQDRAN